MCIRDSYTTERGMERLQNEMATFETTAEKKFKELEEAFKSFNSYMDMGFITKIATTDVPSGYIEGVDMNIYRAIGMQKDHVRLCVTDTYERIYDYSKYFKVGVVGMS